MFFALSIEEKREENEIEKHEEDENRDECRICKASDGILVSPCLCSGMFASM